MLQVSLSPYKNHESKACDIHRQVISYERGEYEKKAIDTVHSQLRCTTRRWQG